MATEKTDDWRSEKLQAGAHTKDELSEMVLDALNARRMRKKKAKKRF